MSTSTRVGGTGWPNGEGPVTEVSPVYEVSKRVLDLIGSLVGLVIFAPFLVIVAILVLASSPGPAIYPAIRAGRYGVPFRMYKFRTMVVGADNSGGLLVGREDPRITPIGKVLRRSKLDELPQLWNVLRGDMSLVGPRPEFLKYASTYGEREQLTLTVRPGMTDFASIEFILLGDLLVNDPDRTYEESILPRKNALRLRYVYQRGFRTDLAILWQTLGRLMAIRA
jgi:lipopolysaccharide/colanic/teichoic acid biosynthesis glycosyltransferase